MDFIWLYSKIKIDYLQVRGFGKIEQKPPFSIPFLITILNFGLFLMRKIIAFYIIISFSLISCGSDDAMEPIPGEDDFSTELFFSEYIEGTSFNKALEIVNFTGETINLEAEGYSIKKQSNGSGNWIGEVLLTGNISHNSVFVIANGSSENPDLINRAHQLKTGAPLDFNGNDPVGLFKDGVLVDLIGALDDPEDFAKDVTLRRNQEISEPSTTFDPEDWEIVEVDNFEDLGRH